MIIKQYLLTRKSKGDDKGAIYYMCTVLVRISGKTGETVRAQDGVKVMCDSYIWCQLCVIVIYNRCIIATHLLGSLDHFFIRLFFFFFF